MKIKRIISRILFVIATWYWWIFRPKEYGVKAIITSGDKVLYIRQGYGHDFYTFPGGRIDKKETPDEAVRREVKEEVGISTTGFTYVGTFVSRAFKKYDTIMVYSVEVPKGTEIKIDGFEVINAGWFDKNSLPEIGPIAKICYGMYERKSGKNK